MMIQIDFDLVETYLSRIEEPGIVQSVLYIMRKRS